MVSIRFPSYVQSVVTNVLMSKVLPVSRSCIESMIRRFATINSASTRFVKCDKCSHFFVLLADNESTKKAKEIKSKKRTPPPTPKKVEEHRDI
jgi:hypothetical protein